MRRGQNILMAALAVGLGAAQAQAQGPQTFFVCYVPDVGAMYLIQLPGLPTECLSVSHVEISWTEGGTEVADGSITTLKLADGAVTTPKLANAAVGTPELADGAVTEVKLSTSVVTARALAAVADNGTLIRGVNATSATRTSAGHFRVTINAGVDLANAYFFAQPINGCFASSLVSAAGNDVSVQLLWNGSYVNCSFTLVVF
ncbi:MAG: hypothetical protein JSW71_07065 [Gemmatimonadota bacterium]|nr:MAG: hypothetical protein JSW71_07065 [Gemmatimonadota bacterium]